MARGDDREGRRRPPPRGARTARGSGGREVARRAPAGATRARRPPPPRDRDRERARARHGGGGGGSDLVARVLAAIPAVAFAIVIVVQGGLVFTLGVALLGLVCLHELYAMYDEAEPVRLAGFVGLLGLLLAALYGAERQVLLAFAATVALTFLLVAVGPRRGSRTVSTVFTVFGVAWIGVALAHAVLLRELPHGAGIIVDILVGTFLGDTGAYLGGRMFGRTPLAPRISPNKTLEGLGIGMLTAVAATWFAGLYQDWLPGWDALLLGLAVAIAAPAGDLFESLVKRDAGTKDTGRLFGAHGGALDRLDAVLFAAVVGFYVWVALM